MSKSPEPSTELDDAGRRLYFRIKGWVTKTTGWEDSDQLLVNEACLHEMRARDARKEFEDSGEGYTVMGSTGSPVVNPIVRVAKDAAKDYVEALKELGLTPKARAQLGIEPKQTGPSKFGL